MYRVIAENAQGERLELTHNRNYDVLDIQGTNPPPAVIASSATAGLDGERITGTRVGKRNLVITLGLHPPIEENRIALYRFFGVKQWVRIYYKNRHRDVYIEGCVESAENNPWTREQQPQISIICPQPYWLSVSDIAVSFAEVQAGFAFPFSITAPGIPFSTRIPTDEATVLISEVETGGIIRFYASGAVTNPRFYNRTANTFFGVDIEMQAGDLITVNTERGEKSATLLRGGETVNLLGDLAEGADWVRFLPGENELSCDAEDGTEYLQCSLRLTQKFTGV